MNSVKTITWAFTECASPEGSLEYEMIRKGAFATADAFDIVHEARDELAGLVRIEVRNGQARDVRLDLLTKLGDEALRGFRE